MNILVFNAGSASLKIEVIAAESTITTPDRGRKLVSGIIEGIGKNAVLSQLQGKQVIHQQPIAAQDYEEATHRALEWLNSDSQNNTTATTQLDLIGHRVVHGGDRFTASTCINDEVIAAIEALAPVLK